MTSFLILLGLAALGFLGVGSFLLFWSIALLVLMTLAAVIATGIWFRWLFSADHREVVQ